MSLSQKDLVLEPISRRNVSPIPGAMAALLLSVVD